jgi:hypothetical protein
LKGTADHHNYAFYTAFQAREEAEYAQQNLAAQKTCCNCALERGWELYCVQACEACKWRKEQAGQRDLLLQVQRLHVAPAAAGSAGEITRLAEERDRLRSDLQHERRAREEVNVRLLQVEEALRGLTRVRQEEVRPSAGARQEARPSAGTRFEGSLVTACISTASRSELEAATQQFAQDRILGMGGFGRVYSAMWRGRNCAIKVLGETSMQGAKEFLKEVNVLGVYRHQNLLPLLGFCISKEDTSLFCALIYPQMRSSLEDALILSRTSQPGSNTVLSSSNRLLIAMDAAAGLAYLHSSVNKPVIMHRDIKSSNILLDAENRARISDVGLASPLETGVTRTPGLGSFGYIDPVYLEEGEYSPGSDVFSFGVVLLELLTGEAPSDSGKSPPNLHARLRTRLPHDTSAVCDQLARWPAQEAELFASMAKNCILREINARPTSGAVMEQLSVMVAQPQPEPAQGVRECMLCMDAPRNTRLRPCCHVVFCENCALEALQRNITCPLCRRRFERYDVGDFNQTYVPA